MNKLMNSRKQLINEIRAVFGPITFPTHKGLRAAMAADDWVSDPETLAQITAKEDIHGEWWEIPEEELKSCTLALCYLDASGIEFYLPAYLSMTLQDLKYENYNHILFLLDPGAEGEDEELYEYFCQQFEKITKGKKKVCIKFLEYLLATKLDQYCESETKQEIENILVRDFWQI